MLAAATLSGCAGMDRTACMTLASITGAALGGTAGGLIASEAAEHGDSGGSKNWEIGLSAGGGFLAGGLIGALIGHAVCEEEPEPAPAPAPRATPPPPPPPPPTERRGG
jgi:hypothetical protein